MEIKLTQNKAEKLQSTAQTCSAKVIVMLAMRKAGRCSRSGWGRVSAHPDHRQVRVCLHLSSHCSRPQDETQSLFHLQLLIRRQASAIAPTVPGHSGHSRNTQIHTAWIQNLKRLGSAQTQLANSLLRHRKRFEYRDYKDGKLKAMLPRLT